jgi:type IV pilus assembly protein PilA
MKAVRMLKSQKGFSLIELMIVVAIIGILATVAVPNFTRFQAKARQSSGKSLLAGYFAAQKATYSEYQYFPGNFPGAGFKPEGQLAYRLEATDNGDATGSATTNPNDVGAVATGCDSTADVPAAALCGNAYLGSWSELASAAVAPPVCAEAAAGAEGAAGSFTACVGSNIGGTQADSWSINQLKVVTNTQNGLP